MKDSDGVKTTPECLQVYHMLHMDPHKNPEYICVIHQFLKTWDVRDTYKLMRTMLSTYEWS